MVLFTGTELIPYALPLPGSSQNALNGNESVLNPTADILGGSLWRIKAYKCTGEAH